MNIRNDDYDITQEKLRSEIEIQERILKSYEKAIYENIGQVLSLAKIQLFSVEQEKKNKSNCTINNSRKMIGRAIQELRYITRQLGPKEITERGFAFATEYELQRINYSKICETDFSSSGSFFRLKKEIELLVFSILQELIQDILIWQANKLVAKLHYSADEVEVKIIHQNKDADVSTVKLINENTKLNNRVKLIGAELTIEKMHNNGLIIIKIKK